MFIQIENFLWINILKILTVVFLTINVSENLPSNGMTLNKKPSNFITVSL